MQRFVLILDEWAALLGEIREALANALRAIFHTRHDKPALAKLQVIFSGGVELYDLVISEASSLHSICEDVYLADLAEAEAVSLIADGLAELGVAPAMAIVLGGGVYTRAAGHPYLTQRIGRELEHLAQRRTALTGASVNDAIAQIRRGDSLLRRIRDDLREDALEDAARRLLTDPPRFTRLDDAMARLELVGIAAERNNRWAPRNPLLAAFVGELLGMEVGEAQRNQGTRELRNRRTREARLGDRKQPGTMLSPQHSVLSTQSSTLNPATPATHSAALHE